jgi:hypothetical protein
MPDSPTPARAALGAPGLVAGLWAVSAVALVAAWVAGAAADSGADASANVGAALSQALWVLIARALAGCAVWCLGAVVLAGYAYRPDRRQAAWGLLAATAGATALIGVAALSNGAGSLPVLWVGQQVVLAVVAVWLHRSWGA